MTGHKRQAAEKSARQYLEMRGFQILETNFKRSKYEIDLIATKNQNLYFMAIHWADDTMSSLDMLAPSNLDRARRAGASWLEENQWTGAVHNGVIILDQISFAVMNIIEDLF